MSRPVHTVPYRITPVLLLSCIRPSPILGSINSTAKQGLDLTPIQFGNKYHRKRVDRAVDASTT